MPANQAEELLSLIKTTDGFKELLSSINNSINDVSTRVAKLESELAEQLSNQTQQDTTLNELRALIEKQGEQIASLEKKGQQDTTLGELRTLIEKQGEQILQLQEQIAMLSVAIAMLQQTIILQANQTDRQTRENKPEQPKEVPTPSTANSSLGATTHPTQVFFRVAGRLEKETSAIIHRPKGPACIRSNPIYQVNQEENYCSLTFKNQQEAEKFLRDSRSYQYTEIKLLNAQKLNLRIKYSLNKNNPSEVLCTLESIRPGPSNNRFAPDPAITDPAKRLSYLNQALKQTFILTENKPNQRPNFSPSV